MDSLRYWVIEMHVDGFRFDLASALAREFHSVDRLAAFFDLVNQDPVVSQVKLIAEPWDVGAGGYQVGGFPPLWTEWNGRYRDTVRDFWRGERRPGRVRVAVHRQLGPVRGRRPTADGVDQLRDRARRVHPADLVSYNDKHNEANGEENRDGESHNRSWNTGWRGRPTTSRSAACGSGRSATCWHAAAVQGVPMISHGDELGRTQGGNNNVYSQDNEISWVDWETRGTTRSSPSSPRGWRPCVRRTRFSAGSGSSRAARSAGRASATSPGCARWTERARGLERGHAQSLAIFLNGEGIPERDKVGSGSSTTRSCC